MQARQPKKQATQPPSGRKARAPRGASAETALDSLQQLLRRAGTRLDDAGSGAAFAGEIRGLLLRAIHLAQFRPALDADLGSSVDSPRPAKLACLMEQAGRTNPKLRGVEFGLRSDALALVIYALFPEFAVSSAARAGRGALALAIERSTVERGAPLDGGFDILNAPDVAKARGLVLRAEIAGADAADGHIPRRPDPKKGAAPRRVLAAAQAAASTFSPEAVAREIAQKALHAAAGPGAMTAEINALFGALRQRASRSQKAKRAKR